MWVAYLALENKYADDPETAVSELLQRALQHTDSKKMYLAAIDMFSKGDARPTVLETCVRGVRRKHGGSCKVWLRLVKLDVAAGKDPTATMARATKALPQRKHVKFLSRVALLEFKEGQPERGRSVYESLLQAHPKRTDLWGVYIDQEIRCGSQASVRNLFERTIHLDLPAKKMRFFFKRYLEYESKHGAQDRVEYVKQRAMEYVQAQE